MKLVKLNKHLSTLYVFNDLETTFTIDEPAGTVDIEWVCISCKTEHVHTAPLVSLLGYRHEQKGLMGLSDDKFLDLATGICRGCFNAMIRKVDYVKD